MASAAAATSHQAPPTRPPPPYLFGRPWPELNEGLSYTDVIRCAHACPSLIDFYSSNYMSSAPREGWIQRIRNGQITIDGVVVRDPSSVLRDGSRVVYHRIPWKEPQAPHLLPVLYEDDDMIAINKPSGLQVLPGGLFQQRTVLMQLQWKDWNNTTSCCSKRKAHPVPVHRLGRGTSGILLCAKTKIAKVRLASYFAEGTANGTVERDEPEFHKARRISKFYRALVTGVLEKDEVEINQPIGLVHYPGVAHGLYVASSSGKPAMSKVCVLERDLEKSQTLVQVEIYSGRPHQIRIHLASIGHPLLGDSLYETGGQPKFCESEHTNGCFAEDGGYQKPLQPVPGDCGYHLHAHWLVLCHPTTNDILKIAAPLPVILQTREELQQRRCE
ncbi:RNA pseudouridine synthase 5 isoform X1 [Ananas comosus]|uniref:RNA pseudouridine synthase 5 isoform X1 n=1 Tax=Ananas comosus TaxID=4615 RepID=A0A6P5GLK1_ANACO|nr:RNA pseudouridine synthase 5 isoform X1 [Ananas comosus]XP_020108672.1 RNA pseudouridine synthase 5 isoform X1 [Ananas comosus]